MTDHIPPYSEEAEQAVIGSVLIDPQCFGQLMTILEPDDFFLRRHAYIWRALERLAERKDIIDYLTVQDELRAVRALDDVGGGAYLTDLLNIVPTSRNAEVYARLVQRTAVRRKVLTSADELKAMAVDETTDTQAVIAAWDKAGIDLRGEKLDSGGLDFGQMIDSYYDSVERMMENPGEFLGLPTGFKDVDNMLLGLQRGKLYILAGRPSMGKTAMLMNTAVNIAKMGGRVGVFSLEQPWDQLVQRIVSAETGINMQRIRLGKLSALEFSRFTEAMSRLHKLKDNIFIDDTPAITPVDMRAKAMQWKYTHGVDVLFLDYLQKMRGAGRYNGDSGRVQEVSYIARSLKDLARELRIPVYAAAQLSRAVEQRQDKRPILSDLKESGDIEQEADAVMFLYRDDYYNEASEFPNHAEVIIAKHRDGPTGAISLYFDKSITAFQNGRTRTVNLGG